MARRLNKADVTGEERALFIAVLRLTRRDLRVARRRPAWMPKSAQRREFPVQEWHEAGFCSMLEEVENWLGSADFAGMCELLDLNPQWVLANFAEVGNGTAS